MAYMPDDMLLLCNTCKVLLSKMP